VILVRSGFEGNTLFARGKLVCFDYVLIHCLNFHFLKFMLDPIGRIQEPFWMIHPGIWAVMRFGQTTAKAVREIKSAILDNSNRYESQWWQ
jgi:hypothetical protein